MLAGLFSFLGEILFCGCYLTNEKSFERPLSKEQEKELLSKASNGDKEAKNKLIIHNMRLVVHIVKKYNCNIDNDELINVGSFGLFKAINSYSIDKKTKFATYAAKCIENEILMHIRANKKNRDIKFLYESIGYDKDGNEIPLIDLIKDDSINENEYEQKELKETLTKIMQEALSLREYEILEFRYGLNDKEIKTQQEISSMYGISRSYVSRIETKALNKIRKYLIEHDINL